MDEAFRPGSSVADTARRHGLNANQLFNWRKATARFGEAPMPEARLPAEASACVTGVDDFVPIGVFARAQDAGPALIAGAQRTPTSRAAGDGTASRRPVMDERPGVIEIELPEGVRLRVDAFVNERALRRVLAALKAAT